MFTSRFARAAAAAVGSVALCATVGATAASASPHLPTVTSVTHYVNRDDSGANGNWAKDNDFRRGVLTEDGSVAVTNCGALNTDPCYGYTLSVKDGGYLPWVQGSFVTDNGVYTPNQAGPYAGDTIRGNVRGSMSGYDNFAEFYSTSLPSGGSNGGVPSFVNGDTPSTSSWPSLYFPNTATLYQGGAVTTSFSQPSWAWNYRAQVPVWTRSHRHHHRGYWSFRTERWTDASYNNYGDNVGDGNIYGYVH